VQRFLRYQAKARSVPSSAAAALHRFLRLLRHQGVIPLQKKPPLSPKQRLLTNYERYLLEERGLTQGTAVHYVVFVNLFLSTRFQKAALELHQLRARDVTGFVCQQAQILSPTRAQLLVTALRSFLRYLRHQGKITTDLAVCVPTVARWSFAALPKFLPAKSIRRVLTCSEQRRTSIGLRDYAILLLLARLGLRASEVVTLDLEDIDWENARVSVRGKGGRWDQMPLPTDVGKAVALYLRHGRPPCSCRRVFILGRAPRQGISRGTVFRLVRAALERAGVGSVHKGAHLFRHSLATNMIRQGASLAEIGELLRHQSPHTTEIYAKVDLPALRPLALPWPGGAR